MAIIGSFKWLQVEACKSTKPLIKGSVRRVYRLFNSCLSLYFFKFYSIFIQFCLPFIIKRKRKVKVSTDIHHTADLWRQQIIHTSRYISSGVTSQTYPQLPSLSSNPTIPALTSSNSSSITIHHSKTFCKLNERKAKLTKQEIIIQKKKNRQLITNYEMLKLQRYNEKVH